MLTPRLYWHPKFKILHRTVTLTSMEIGTYFDFFMFKLNVWAKKRLRSTGVCIILFYTQNDRQHNIYDKIMRQSVNRKNLHIFITWTPPSWFHLHLHVPTSTKKPASFVQWQCWRRRTEIWRRTRRCKSRRWIHTQNIARISPRDLRQTSRSCAVPSRTNRLSPARAPAAHTATTSANMWPHTRKKILVFCY